MTNQLTFIDQLPSDNQTWQGKKKPNEIEIYPIPLPITKRPPNTKNRRPSPISENFSLANLTFNWSPLENNLKINLPFVGFPPNTKN